MGKTQKVQAHRRSPPPPPPFLDKSFWKTYENVQQQHFFSFDPSMTKYVRV